MVTSPMNSNGTSTRDSVDAKIMADLSVVEEKIDLCIIMLQQQQQSVTSGEFISSNDTEALLSVIGFLEACAPRMIELVEAAAQGAVSESVLMKCLDVNDRLTKALSDSDAVQLTAGPATASTMAASVPQQDVLDDLFFDEDHAAPGAAAASGAVGGGKTTGEDDDDHDIFTSTKPPPDEATLKNTSSEDEFDDFFSQRASGM